MNCNQTTALIAAHADGELDLLRAHAVARHLRTCPDCAASRQQLIALRTRIRTEAPRFVAPADLRARVSDTLAGWQDAAPPPRMPLRARWGLLGAGALAGCAATVLALMVGTALVDWRARDDIAAEAVAAHVRAQLDNHLIAIASSDQHTVKPWLSQRLDYSPPVQDFADAGFPLAGGRLDQLARQPVATLVYHYRLHTVDVFVRPASGQSALEMRTLRGFNVASATGAGMQWVAVSDVSPDMLSQLVRRMAGSAGAP